MPRSRRAGIGRSVVAGLVTSTVLALLATGCTPVEGPTPPSPSPTFSAGKISMSDDFGRTVKVGWGDADLGGAYRLRSDEGMSVANGVGTMKMTVPGRTCSASLDGVQPRDLQGSVDLILDRLPATGYGTYVGIQLRSDGSYYYRVGVRVGGDGRIYVSLARYDGDVATRVPLGRERIMEFRAKAGEPVHVEFRVAGVTPVQLSTLVTAASATPKQRVPVVATDAAASRLVGGGALDLWTYASKTTPGSQEVDFDNLRVQRLVGNV